MLVFNPLVGSLIGGCACAIKSVRIAHNHAMIWKVNAGMVAIKQPSRYGHHPG